MIKKIAGEQWKTIALNGHPTGSRKYAISSSGKAASFTNDLHEDGKLLKGSVTGGYKTLNLHYNEQNLTIYLHREVAKSFCKKKSARYKFVIHLNHNKTDNQYRNLQWATAEEMSDHQQNSPLKLAYKKHQAETISGSKLDARKVRMIKNLINNPKLKLSYKQIAEKYSISEMSVYRIKRGENWSHIN